MNSSPRPVRPYAQRITSAAQSLGGRHDICSPLPEPLDRDRERYMSPLSCKSGYLLIFLGDGGRCSLHSPGGPGTHYRDQTGLEFTKCLLSTGINRVCHHYQLNLGLLRVWLLLCAL